MGSAAAAHTPTLGAMCIFVGGGACFVTVAWLRHGREGGENGFVEFVIGFLTRAVAHRVASFGYPVGPRGAVAPLCMEFSGDADGARRVEARERLSGCARRNSTSPRAGEITTERRPAATSPAALAWLTAPSWSPIWVAATMTVREVA